MPCELLEFSPHGILLYFSFSRISSAVIPDASSFFSTASASTFLEYVSKRKIRKFEWILRQFKEETRRLSSAKSSFVTQKLRSAARNCGLGNLDTL